MRGWAKQRAEAETVRRFWTKVNIGAPDECWLWTAGRYDSGYGMFAGRKDGRGACAAHRFAYQLTHGPLRPDQHLMHACDVRHCVNPAHMSIGTQAENIRDAARKGRMPGRRGHMRTIPLLLVDACLKGPRGTLMRLAREYNINSLSLRAAVYRERRRRRQERAA